MARGKTSHSIEYHAAEVKARGNERLKMITFNYSSTVQETQTGDCNLERKGKRVTAL